MIYYFAIFFLSLLIPLSFSSAFGVVEDFTTSKSVYYQDDQLSVFGNVSYDTKIPYVTIQIFTPGKSNFADFNQILVNSDGSFSTAFHVGGPTWTSYGSYSIKVTYDGSMEKSIQYKKSSTTTSESNPKTTTEPAPNPKTTTEPAPNPKTTTEPAPNPKTTTEPTIPKPKPRPSFVDPEKDPYYYIDRYNNEAIYKEWFDENYPNYTIKEAVGIPESIPGWIKDNAKGWADGQTGESEFVSGIEYMVKEKIIYIPDLPSQASTTAKAVPDWIKNNAGWWADGQIDEDEFVNSLKFLIQEGIIDIS